MTVDNPPPTSTIWKRRAVLMGIVGLLIAIPVTLILRDGGEDEPATEPGIEERFPVNPAVVEARLDATYQVPVGWTQSEKSGVVTFRSKDRAVRVGLAAPAPAERADQVLDDALAALRAGYEMVEVSPGSGQRVGGLRAEGAVVRAQGDDIDLTILVAVMKGREKAYLLELFTPVDAPKRSVAEAQRFLNSLELNG